MKKNLKIKDEFLGNTVTFSGIVPRTITLTADISPENLNYLYSKKHPAIVEVPEPKPKVKEEPKK